MNVAFLNSASELPWRTTWGEVIAALASLDGAACVFFGAGPDSPDDPCMVADVDELDEADDVPPECAERGWNTGLLKEQIQGVIANLTAQLGHRPDTDLVLRGVAHYVDNDAFLEVT